MILDPGYDLTLRPLRYPVFDDMYRNAIKNTWTAEEVTCELQFAEDLLDKDVPGLSNLDLEPRYGARNPFGFMDLQDVQELSNFFERRVSAYQVAVSGEVSFDESF